MLADAEEIRAKVRVWTGVLVDQVGLIFGREILLADEGVDRGGLGGVDDGGGALRVGDAVAAFGFEAPRRFEYVEPEEQVGLAAGN